MGKKENPRVSINTFERVAKERFPDTIIESWFDIEVTIKKTLPLSEVMTFVNNVTESCFLEDGTFMPEIMDFMLKSEALERYAHFAMPSDIGKQYSLVYGTNAFSWLCEHINTNQLNEIETAINRKIKYLCDSDIMALRSKLSELIGTFNKVQEETANLFDGVSPEEVQAVMNSVGNGIIDEEKLINAYADRMGYDLSPDVVEAETVEKNA